MRNWKKLIDKKRTELKILALVIIISLSCKITYAQEIFTLNQGGTSQKDYYTEIADEDIRWAPIIKVYINNKEYRFILDTGAPTVITRKLFDELKPDVIYKMPILDANNVEDSLHIVRLKEIKIGNVIFNDIPTVVPKDHLIYDCVGVDGSIGSNLLRNSIIQFSSKSRKLVITDQPEKLNLQIKQGSELQLNFIQSTPVVKIDFFGRGSASIPAVFDSGNTSFIDIALNHFVATKTVDVFNIQAKSRGKASLGLYGFGNDTTQYRLVSNELKINGTAFKGVNLNTTIGEDTMIGARLLKYGLVTIDYRNKKFYFEPYQQSFDLSEELFPVSLIPVNNKLRVGTIWDEQLIDNFSVDDQVLAIDGVSYTTVSSCDIIRKQDFFMGKTQVILTLMSADGKTRNVTIRKM